MLGYVFNFSIVYSNYAIEALYSIKVFQQRVKDTVKLATMKQKHAGGQDVQVIEDYSEGLRLEHVYS